MLVHIDDDSSGDEEDGLTWDMIGAIADFARIAMRAEAVRASRVHWLHPDASEAERLRCVSRTRSLTEKETRLLMYHDGTTGILGLSAPPEVCWQAIRSAVKARAIVVFWLGCTVENTCRIGGVARTLDEEAFKSDFVTL
eukprot:5704452-Prymnesium_polylepis.5